MGNHADQVTDRSDGRAAPGGSGRRLPAELAMYRADNARHRLPRLFGRGDLVMLGLGVMIGAGIFTLAGTQAATNAGPAVILSFVVAACVSLLAALCYAELSSAIPVAGSAYTFSYVIFGETAAWLVGWSLVLELLLAGAVVARSWGSYFLATVQGAGGDPGWLAPYATFDAHFNVFAIAMILLLTALLVTGTKLSARLIRTVVLAKIAVIVFVVILGALFIHASNYTPLIPESRPLPPTADSASTVLQWLTGGPGQKFGLSGVFSAAAVIVFSYIGFDLIATAAEDAREPRRTVPSGILRSVGLVTVFYLAMAAVMVGMQPYTKLDANAPISHAFAQAGAGWAAEIINLGALLAISTVVMVVLVALSRVIFAMGRDGMLPVGLSRISRTFSSPARAAVTGGLATVLVSLYPNVGALQETLIAGALFAFLFCAVGVLVSRVRQPDLERGFRVPGGPVLPVAAIATIIWMMLHLHLATWRNFAIWMVVGLLGYLLYGRRHSRLARGDEPVATETSPQPAVAGAGESGVSGDFDDSEGSGSGDAPGDASAVDEPVPPLLSADFFAVGRPTRSPGTESQGSGPGDRDPGETAGESDEAGLTGVDDSHDAGSRGQADETQTSSRTDDNGPGRDSGGPAGGARMGPASTDAEERGGGDADEPAGGMDALTRLSRRSGQDHPTDGGST